MSIRLVCATFVLAAGMSIHRFSMKVPPGSTDFTDFQVYSEESKPNVTVTATFAANNATRVEVLLLNEEELSAVLRHNNASVPAGAVLCTPTGVSFPSELARDPPTYSSCDTARNSSFLLEFSGEGTYTLVFAACSARGSEVSIAGEVIGPRPADKDHPLRIFNRTMAQTYVCVLLFWLGLLLYYRATAIAIQKWVITGVLLCCFCEHFTAYADWKYYELQGTHHPVFVGASLLLNAWKNSISRMLLVVLCLGFGVVKSEVGPNLPKVVLLGFAYFASYLAYNVILYFFHTDVTSSEVLFAATLPIACLDVGFYYWTLTSIKAVKRVLKELKWEFKLQVYERMTSILILSVILSVAWLCIELFFRSGGQWHDYWRVAWMFDSLWQFVFLLITTALVWLWRPDSRSNLLTFTEQPSFEEDRGLEEEKEPTHAHDDTKFAKETYLRRGPHSFSIED